MTIHGAQPQLSPEHDHSSPVQVSASVWKRSMDTMNQNDQNVLTLNNRVFLRVAASTSFYTFDTNFPLGSTADTQVYRGVSKSGYEKKVAITDVTPEAAAQHQQKIDNENLVLTALGSSPPATIRHTHNDITRFHQVYPYIRNTENLQLFLQNNAAISLEDKLSIALECCQAIKKIHDRNIAHGNIRSAHFDISIERTSGRHNVYATCFKDSTLYNINENNEENHNNNVADLQNAIENDARGLYTMFANDLELQMFHAPVQTAADVDMTNMIENIKIALQNIPGSTLIDRVKTNRKLNF